MKTLIVGYGNPFRSDDGIGWYIAQRLSREISDESIRVIAAHQLTPEMADFASRAERVVFVDATRNGMPGDLHCEPVVPGESQSRYSHELTPAVVVRLAKELYGQCPAAHIFTVTGESFETGEKMSAPVTAAIPALIGQIKQLIGH